MKISNLNITKNMKLRTTALVLAGTLSMTALTGCSNSNVTTDNDDYTSAYAIIVIDNNATILEVKNLITYNTKYKITTTDGSVINSSSVNTFIFKDENTDISVEEFAQHIVGDDGMVNYLGQDKVKSK